MVLRYMDIHMQNDEFGTFLNIRNSLLKMDQKPQFKS